MIRRVLSYNDDGSESVVAWRRTDAERDEQMRVRQAVLDILGHPPRTLDEAVTATLIQRGLKGRTTDAQPRPVPRLLL